MAVTSQSSGPNEQHADHNTQHYQVQLPMFEGPLDLLLHLIEREELDITKVALAQVTDQYLAYLAILKEIEVEFLTDFLVVAAKLLFIKSQALLPTPPPSLVDEEEEDIGAQLAHQLRVYKQFKIVAQTLRQREANGLKSFIRMALPPKFEPRLAVGEVTLDDLVAAVHQALEVRPADPAVSEVVSPITVTIGQQMTLIRDELTHRTQINFRHLLGQAASRVEIIATFLAVLELIKQYVIEVRQDTSFGDIVIFPNKSYPQGPVSEPAAQRGAEVEFTRMNDSANDPPTEQNIPQE
jgi:segregation and condensation protein A